MYRIIFLKRTSVKMRIMPIILGLFVSSVVYAQEIFEGEIAYQTFEQYSDYLLRMGNSIVFNGVHTIRLILKGSKVHVIDETTGCHIVCDDDAKTYIHYCDHTKTGLDISSNIESQLMLLPRDITYSNFTAVLKSNSFGKTETTKALLGKSCTLYEGTMVRDVTMINTYDIKAYVADSIVAPSGYKYHNQGMDIPNIALYWAFKYDGGHVGVFGVGELSFYIEADVTEIIPRVVNDDEFSVPSDYKISTKAKNGFAIMKYYNGVKKQLESLGIKGGEKNEKQSGVHYKTEGEWDF